MIGRLITSAAAWREAEETRSLDGCGSMGHGAEQEQWGPEGGPSRRRRWLMLGLATALALLIFSSTHVRIAMTSAVFLNEVFPDSPVYPGRWITGEPHRLLVQFPHEDQFHGAYWYRPAQLACHAGIVMYIGLGPEYGDQHLDRIARAFARSGVSVLIPVSEDMVNYSLAADEHEIAASAFEYLRNNPEIHPDRVGMFGISVGGAIIANAAQEERIRENVAMIHSLGGYYDANMVLSHMAIRAYEVEGEWIDWEPSSTTFRATRNSLVPLMPSEDRIDLWEMFDEEAAPADLPSDLTDDGRALAEILINRDPQRIDELLAGLPDDVRGFLQGISPAQGVEMIEADVFLLHDRFDHVLPYSETVRFASDLDNVGHERVYTTIIEQFHHVRPDEEGDTLSLLGDGFQLYRHIFRMYQSMDHRGWFTSPLNLLPILGDSETCH